MPTDDERRRVAERLRAYAETPAPWHLADVLRDVLDEKGDYDRIRRLADLIEPVCDVSATHTDASATCGVSQSRRSEVDPTERGIDSIYDWCFSGIEGSDEDEDELYCAIMRAIENYRHPERADARTVRPVDRETLLALADEMKRDAPLWWSQGERECLMHWSRRIREACGEVA